jgi:hypothetical protein
LSFAKFKDTCSVKSASKNKVYKNRSNKKKLHTKRNKNTMLTITDVFDIYLRKIKSFLNFQRPKCVHTLLNALIPNGLTYDKIS